MSLKRLKDLLEKVADAEAEVEAATTAANDAEAEVEAATTAANDAKDDSDSANNAHKVAANDINGQASVTAYLAIVAQQNFSLWREANEKLNAAEKNAKTATSKKAEAVKALASAKDSLMKAEIAICKKQLPQWDNLSCEKKDIVLNLMELNARDYENGEDDFAYFEF